MSEGLAILLFMPYLLITLFVASYVQSNFYSLDKHFMDKNYAMNATFIFFMTLWLEFAMPIGLYYLYQYLF